MNAKERLFLHLISAASRCGSGRLLRWPPAKIGSQYRFCNVKGNRSIFLSVSERPILLPSPPQESRSAPLVLLSYPDRSHHGLSANVAFREESASFARLRPDRSWRS